MTEILAKAMFEIVSSSRKASYPLGARKLREPAALRLEEGRQKHEPFDEPTSFQQSRSRL